MTELCLKSSDWHNFVFFFGGSTLRSALIKELALLSIILEFSKNTSIMSFSLLTRQP